VMDALDYFAIQNLIHRYADLLDRGKVDEVGALFDHADVFMPDEPEPWSRAGQNKMAEIFRLWTRFYPEADGRPRTRHVTTNLIIEPDGPNRAKTQSYVIVFQSVENFPIQPIIGGTYNDKFEKVDGAWRFTERREEMSLYGDLRHHLLQPYGPA
jgi:3-phenylpropionate/cinnamic acid dioxygenase small subunit